LKECLVVTFFLDREEGEKLKHPIFSPSFM
jgi:hypothetical protein